MSETTMSDSLDGAVAIVGMAGRFPGASDIEQFWENLCAGRESIVAIPEKDLEDRLTPAERSRGRYIASRGLLGDVDRFDAEFFHFLPRDAELTDPQQRVLLECAWQAFEDAGYDPAKVTGNVGVFAGSSINTYLLLHLASDSRFREEFTRSYQVGSFPALIGNGQDFLATRISYKLNLRGPAITVQSACSTSLVAVAQAWQSLTSYQSDMALAGAVSISLPEHRGYFYQEGGMVSPDGHCRPFDQSAAGTVFGAGAGMVLLKRASDAVADGDHIYALILGAGINNDGSEKVGYAAPASQGQANAIAMAYGAAGVEPSSVGYVECHGTGTPLGDPIEVSALARVFRSSSARIEPCILGSVKGNVGHLDVAAGMAGLVKATLSLDRGQIPGTLHYRVPNPELHLEQTPFAITSELKAWPRVNDASGGPRRAGVSAFGVGGTNVHLVLEEAPAIVASAPSHRSRHILCLSARTETALDAERQRLAESFEMERAADAPLPDIAYTLAVGRREFAHRFAIAAASREAAVAELRQPTKLSQQGKASAKTPRLVMLFPGQGSQYPGMAQDLYRAEPLFRSVVDECCQQLRSTVGIDLFPVLYPAIASDTGPAAHGQAAKVLEQTRFAQPAIFVVSYALARLWMSWGVTPACLAGHSVGELVAACLAGVFSLEDALLFVAHRGEWMQKMAPGAMLAVRMPAAELEKIMPPSLSIAGINSPSLSVVSGPTVEIEALAAQFERDRVAARRLHTSHAFHSAMVEPIIEPLRELLSTMTLAAPRIEIVSTVTGERMTAAEATSPEYWSKHCRRTVNFSAAAAAMVADGYEMYLEAGPGDTLAMLLRQQVSREGHVSIFTSLPDSRAAGEYPQKPAWDVLAPSLAAMWTQGLPVDWNAYYAGEQRRRVALPTYPFERKRYWVDVKEAPADGVQAVLPARDLSTYDSTENMNFSPESEKETAPLTALENAMSDRNTLTVESDPSAPAGDRHAQFQREVAALLEDLSGLELPAEQYEASFLELGFDSLFLTQVAQQIETNYGVKITFRQLLDDVSSIDQVAGVLDRQAVVKETAEPMKVPVPTTNSASVARQEPAQVNAAGAATAGSAATLEQLQVMAQWIQNQLQALGAPAPGIGTSSAATIAVPPAPETRGNSSTTGNEKNALFSHAIPHHSTTMTPEQKHFLDQLVDRYVRRTAKSKAFTQEHRHTLADPRVVSGFHPEWKEMVYSIVSTRSEGSKLWDIDGNEYIDLLNGFGPTMFGHSPRFVTEAIQKQLQEGFAIGPQTPLAGRAADLLTEMTSLDRVTFCNTGSEAVMAAMRIARTVTARDKVVFFSGDYHGQFDEVLAKQWHRKGEFGARPAAPGIPRASLGNIVVLDYGTEEAVEYIERHAAELAAVLIEPVQSRHPGLQPKEFLERVREITRKSGTAFILDEVVTGFRIHPRGAQGYYGIDADMATYGKVVAGGMPIGILAGKSKFMDALDGGFWQFGDTSVPEVGMTFFAGTFVRHPLTMAALCATLEYIRDSGEALYRDLNDRADRLAESLTETFQSCEGAVHLEHCGSVFFLSVPPEIRFGGLLHYLLREKGLFILEGFPFYLTTAHSDADLEHVVRAFRESVAEMQRHGLLPGASKLQAAPLDAVGKSSTKAPTSTAATPAEVHLTEPQMEVLMAAQTSDEASCAFNESFRITFDGPLDRAALQSAWQSLVDRHDALRMTLTAAGDRIEVGAARSSSVEFVDWSGLDFGLQQEKLRTLVAEEGKRAFRLHQDPLVRVKLVRFAPERHVLVVTAHHLICDGWSTNVMVEELGKLYTAAVRGVPAALPPVMAFSEYALETRMPQHLEQEKNDLDYWKRQLTPVPELLTLPADRNRPAERGFAGSTLVVEFPGEFHAALRKAGAREGCTLFTTLLAGWEILLWRLSGNADPVVMVPAAAQSQMVGKVMVGHCVHLLPIRQTLDPQMSAAEAIHRLKPVILDAYEHQSVTYGSLVRELAPERWPGRLPLSEIQFNLEKVGRNASFEGLKTEVRANGKQAVNFDLFLNIVDTGSGLRLECDYSTGLYDESTIARWLGCYRELLEAMIAEPSRTIASLSLLDGATRHELQAFNNTVTGPLDAENVPELVARAFAELPSQPAADFYGVEMGRAELAERSDRLASWLLRHGGGPNTLVGIYMDRSLEMLVAILGVMKAGAAYVPLDPAFPPVRIAQIVEETKIPVMLTLARHVEDLPKSTAQVLALDTGAAALAREPLAALPAVPADARAYVIFTSGSTGRPKGVELPHRAVVNLLTDLKQRLEMSASDRWLAVTTLSFDISVLEMLLPLVSGGTVLIAHRDDIVDGARLMELLEANRATALQATPVTWRMLLDHGFRPRPGFKMFCGGEAWTTAMADQLLGKNGETGARLWNMYGPTETTVWSSVTEMKAGLDRMTIGPPIANTRFYVLDERLQPVPPGVSGELMIAGMGVANGYFERPELTAEKFLTDPFLPSERMYRTGDEVRQLADGRIEFLGRLDRQVKLRGFRIELGDIETSMRALPGVRDAVAVLRPDGNGDSMLVGYYTGAEGRTATELRHLLREDLPTYMVPSVLQALDQIPLTPNGKVNHRALPEVQIVSEEKKEEFVEAATATEKVLEDIFRDVLGCGRISTQTSLLDLGADSLRMFQIASRAHRRGLAVTVSQLMRLHTIEAVAAALDVESEGVGASLISSAPLRRVSREGYRLDR